MTTRRTWIAAAVLVGGTCLLVAKLALSPFWPLYSADECRRAYAEAGSLADTLRLDLHPLRAESGVKRYCGEVRGVSQDPSLIASRRQP